jgi:hypothetical protein
MIAALAALAAHAQDEDREPTEAQLAQSLEVYLRVFEAAKPIVCSRRTPCKVWEGTHHIIDPNLGQIGFVKATGAEGVSLTERWVTWDSDLLYTIPGQAFSLEQVEPMTWPEIIDVMPAGEHPVIGMEVAYKQLNAAEVASVSNQFVPLEAKTLYKVEQILLNEDGTISNVVAPGVPGAADGYLLRVYANGIWQDHWTFKPSFEPFSYDDTLPLLHMTPIPSGFIGSSAGNYYGWAANTEGATRWAFVQNLPSTVIVP